MNLAANSIDKAELINQNKNGNLKDEKILCHHCKRTKNNGISCMGICVSDNEY
ncbi:MULTISPECIES: hypothetical protein [unclassified Prochlorococcus]|uniref:hypothetical protein n=1 Tax=unclassified Prochlorococcus TaxID=2627481 RepID=UPI00053375F5|nr:MULTISPECIES: hypothetical protein [unclassified Prochlorococcus]KGG14645.1 hypothetical protein EV06_1704 [Prochlorococcus sp. MIT 0602]KGG15926.1 hypothetical protein EV07_1893 [Prochlorococcus sp. MIT 0603]